MSDTPSQLFKRSLHIFDLPPELLSVLQPKGASTPQLQPEGKTGQLELDPSRGETPHLEEPTNSSLSCGLCKASFQILVEQRQHVKTDWHGYNLKQKLRGGASVSEAGFVKLSEDTVESISGSDSTSSEDEEEVSPKEGTLSTSLQKQEMLCEADDNEVAPKKRKRECGGSPLFWFSSPLLPLNISLGIYKAMFTDLELPSPNILQTIKEKQLRPLRGKPTAEASTSGGVTLPNSTNSPKIFLCMIGGGHFAGMIVLLTPKIGKNSQGIEEHQAIIVAHKTFHRYTTRRKQGGSQSANDSAKGAAHSAGAGIRRHNEAALETEVRSLLGEWRDMIKTSELLFVRATSTANRRILFGPYGDQVLRQSDPRVRSFPFSTRRATQAELMRAFGELTRVKISKIDDTEIEATAATAAAAGITARQIEAASKVISAQSKPSPTKLSREEEVSLLHTSQLQALIRRSKAPAVLSYLSNNDVSPDFVFQPRDSQVNRHASTPLHLAASLNSVALIHALLLKSGANPTALNGEGKPAFDLTRERSARDAFRVARSELGENKWNWSEAHCPPPISKDEAKAREASERRESEKIEIERKKVEAKRLREEALFSGFEMSGDKILSRAPAVLERTGAEQREQEARGLTPGLRIKLERERRARAAEERIRKMTSSASGGKLGM